MHARQHLDPTPRVQPAAHQVERRSEHDVRARFEEACTLVAPCFDPARQWGKQPLNHLAMRILRERFTDLGDAELMVMLNGIRRLHDKRRAPAPSLRG
ncbi:MAG: hypothetical protein IPI03_22780 [Rubrivivax sp.]|nr:hypothetical protein [Rubrivivax sp.]MBK7264506.1 hypothetical protein [Rubrivivax sp.]MBK8530043.1 hypothetical protein [Rubrivivax sp.]